MTPPPPETEEELAIRRAMVSLDGSAECLVYLT